MKPYYTDGLERPGELLDQWRDHAACRGLGHLMDPPNPAPEQIDDAVTICLGCPVLDDCHRWVMGLPERHDPGGVCAAWTESDRCIERHRRNGLRDRIKQLEAAQ